MIDSPKNLAKAVTGIKVLIREDDVLSSYAKLKDFKWYKGVGPYGTVLATGLSSQAIATAMALVIPPASNTLRWAAIRLAHSNPGPVRDALLPVLAKTGSGAPKSSTP